MGQLSFSEACKIAVEEFSYYMSLPVVTVFIASCFNKTVEQVQMELDYWRKLK